MRISRSIAILAAGLVLPAALAAQGTPNASRPAGCRGTTSETSSITLAGANGQPVVIPSYPMIETVQPGSPAERAGMRYGDLVLLQDGRDLVGNPPEQPRLAGDTVQFVVLREGREVPITVVLGAWDPQQETPDVERVCRPLATTAGRD